MHVGNGMDFFRNASDGAVADKENLDTVLSTESY